MPDISGRKVAVITGANAGIGYTLAQRLVTTYPNIRLCLACRSRERAIKAAACLEALSPDADISVTVLDTANLQSVYAAAEDIRTKYEHIDLLYLNAGMMSVTGLNWSCFWQGLFSSRVFFMFTTGEGLLVHEDSVTEDGLQRVFETNVFGHYVLIKELENRLGSASGGGESVSQLIWTSSSSSLEHNFDFEDFQCKKMKDPYSSSKFAMDVISVGLNNKMNKQNIYSHCMCPGLVMTNMTFGILPPLFWTLVLPFMWLLRIFVPSITYSTTNGTEALLWLSKQDPRTLDPQTKFQSKVNMFGDARVDGRKMNIDPDRAEQLLHELDKLDIDLRSKHKGTKHTVSALSDCH